MYPIELARTRSACWAARRILPKESKEDILLPGRAAICETTEPVTRVLPALAQGRLDP